MLSKKSLHHPPQRIETRFAVLTGICRILSHVFHRGLRHRVHEGEYKAKRCLTHRAARPAAIGQFSEISHHLVSGRTAFWGDLARNRELGECVPLLRESYRPVGPVLPDSEELLPNLRPRWQALQGRCSHLPLQFQIELVEELGFGFEVREQRAIWNTCLFRDSSCGGTKSLCDDDTSFCFQDGNPLLVASRPGHGEIILESVWTVNYKLRFAVFTQTQRHSPRK